MGRVLRATGWGYHRLKRGLLQRFTPMGVLLVGGCVVAAVLGLDTRLNVSYQLFVLLCTVLAVAGLGSFSLPLALEAKRCLPRCARVDEPVRYRVVLHNKGHRPLRGVSLQESLAMTVSDATPVVNRERTDRVHRWSRCGIASRLSGWRRVRDYRPGAEIKPAVIEMLPGGATGEFTLTLIPRCRGFLQLDALLMLRPDPLGLLNGIQRLESRQRLLVLPRTYPIPALAFSGTRQYQPGGVNLALSVGNEDEFVGLREYRPGESLRNIHWKSLARLGKLVVKEYQDEFFVRYGLVLDTDRAPGPSPTFEAAVSAAASFANAQRHPDALLDLLFVANRAYQVTAGRGLGLNEHLLKVLAAVQPKPGSWSHLDAVVQGHASALSACICILLDWDDDRRRLVRSLRQRGVQVVAIVIGERAWPPEPGVHIMAPDQVPQRLAQLTLHHDISSTAATAA